MTVCLLGFVQDAVPSGSQKAQPLCDPQFFLKNLWFWPNCQQSITKWTFTALRNYWDPVNSSNQGLSCVLKSHPLPSLSFTSRDQMQYLRSQLESWDTYHSITWYRLETALLQAQINYRAGNESRQPTQLNIKWLVWFKKRDTKVRLDSLNRRIIGIKNSHPARFN